LFCSLLVWDRVFLCSSVWPQTPDPPAAASQVLGLQMCPHYPIKNCC
jgi:hypothetical protein